MKPFIRAAMFLLAMTGSAWAQPTASPPPPGRVYTFHSSAQAGCPALDWHVVVGPGGSLTGMISWNNMESMARAVGQLNMQAQTYQMTAREIGGQERTATIDGTVKGNGWLVANIHGANVSCTGIDIPWFAPTTGGGGG